MAITAQTICVGVGLWLNHSFIASSIRHDVERQASERLSLTAERLATAQVADTGRQASIPDSASRTRAEPSAMGTFNDGAVVLDAERRIAKIIRHTPAMSASRRWTTGSPFPTWHVLPDQEGASNHAPLGTFALNGETLLAARTPLNDNSGRQLIVFTDRRDIERTAAALTAPLRPIAALTLLWSSALLGIGVYLIVSRFYDDADGERDKVQADRLRQSQEIVRTRDAVILGLAELADSRDSETGAHLERITAYSSALTATLRRDRRFTNQISASFVRLIAIGSALHDIGKVGIEDRILLKPGPLDDDEREAMQLHAVIGGKCLERIERQLGSSNFLQIAREVAFAHHEKWDGTGYPLGLKGEEIPLAARIVAVADVYDALSSKRVYKNALPHRECVEIMRQDAGKHFDPDIIDVWLTIESQFERFAQRYWPHPHAAGDGDSSSSTSASPESPNEDQENEDLVLHAAGDSN